MRDTVTAMQDALLVVNLATSVGGFFLAWSKLTNAMTRIETRLDGVESNMKRIEDTLNKDVQKLERIVQLHSEKLARLEATVSVRPQA
jgi:hypothetical protein